MNLFRYGYLLLFVLGCVLLFSPLVWLEIGPRGKEYYGEGVPDIRIFGAWLYGKDLGFVPLLVMMLLQFFFILLGCGLSWFSFWVMKRTEKFRMNGINGFLFALVLSYPVFLNSYVDMIINNSDGAASDLTIHWSWGLIVYAGIAVILAVTATLFMVKGNAQKESV